MPPLRRRPTLIALGGLMLAAASARAQAPGEDLAAERLAAGLALNAKLLCSGVFVAGRDPQQFIAEDLQSDLYTFHDWNRVALRIDRDRRQVVLGYPGQAARTARYVGDQGCVLLPQFGDDVFFRTEPVARPEPDGWPAPAAELSATVRSKIGEALRFGLDDSRQSAPQLTRALLVLHRGRLVGELYAPGFGPDSRQIAWSMGKSVTSALVGILTGRGQLALDDPAPVALWRRQGDPRGGITLRHLLQMSGGLAFDNFGVGDSTYYTSRHHHELVYFGAVNVFDYVLDRPVAAPPGTLWAYRNTNTLTLGHLIRQAVEASGESYFTFPQRALFGPIGARNMVLEPDPYGNFITSGFVYGTANDWARFGQLHLQDGVWQGKRILPAGWVDFIRTPAPAHPSKGYGGQFWLNLGGRYPRWPRDAYWAQGWLGQMVLVIPSRDLVIVRLGHSAKGGFDGYIEEVVARILDATAGIGR